MKRSCGFLLALALLLGLAACGQSAEARWQEQYDLGMQYLSEEKYEEAVSAFTAAVEIDPKQVDAYLGLADTHTALGDYAQAREALEQAGAQAGDDARIAQRMEALDAAEAAARAQAAEERYTEFLQNGDYLRYMEEEDLLYGLPDEYALLDIDGDGIRELILQNQNDVGFGGFLVFRYDGAADELRLIPFDVESDWQAETWRQYYGTLWYSAEHRALVFTEMNNPAYYDSYGYWTLSDDGLAISFSVYFDTDFETMEMSYYTCQGENTQSISLSDFLSYADERVDVVFQPI